jgi:ATP-dependent RNA helicase RhlE
LTKFNNLGLAEVILRALNAEGYTDPTPIQKKAIPAMVSGTDLIGIAQTGTGKTAAFLLPLLNRIAKSRTSPGPKGCTTLIIAPTRELVNQIADGVAKYGQFIPHSAAVVVGGVKPHKQIKRMAPGVDILVATPGRLEDHIKNGIIQLNSTTTIILDEADQMLDLGFMPAIRRIMGKLPRNRQTVLFSATMPKQIRKLANEFLKDPVEIAVTPESRPIDKIDQSIIHVEKPAKRKALVAILKDEAVTRAIVFCRTKHGANKVSKYLVTAGLRSSAIHGNKSQNQREKTLAAFKSGEINVLVATDVAARGIDIDAVSHVINLDLPEVSEVYVHRIGRTARAGASGIAISLVDSEQRPLLRDIEKLIGQAIPVTGSPPVDFVVADATPKSTTQDQPKKQDGGRNRSRNRNRGRKKPGAKPSGNAAGQAPANRPQGGKPKKKKSRNRRRSSGGTGPSAVKSGN